MKEDKVLDGENWLIVNDYPADIPYIYRPEIVNIINKYKDYIYNVYHINDPGWKKKKRMVYYNKWKEDKNVKK